MKSCSGSPVLLSCCENSTKTGAALSALDRGELVSPPCSENVNSPVSPTLTTIKETALTAGNANPLKAASANYDAV